MVKTTGPTKRTANYMWHWPPSHPSHRRRNGRKPREPKEMTSQDLRAIDKRRMLANSERANDYWAENYAIDTLAMTVEIERLQAERDAARAEAAVMREAVGKARGPLIEAIESMVATHYALDRVRPSLDKIEGPNWEGIFDGLINEKDWLDSVEFYLRTQPAPAAREEGK